MINSYSLLINTCDKFEDCWEPFFKLFKTYWPDFKGTIYLNTEHKSFKYPGLNVISTQVCTKNNVPEDKRATWSQCLKWALEQIDDEVILYMQEDYFFNNKVQSEWVEHFYNLICSNGSIKCIQLTTAGIPAIKESNYKYLYTSNPDYFSYVSCQASFWRKTILISLIREHETAWNFEWWGSKRAKLMEYQFLTIGNDFVDEHGTIMPYLLTGIVGGKWLKEVPELFKEHEIILDYSQRGFYEKLKPTLKKRLKTKFTIWKIRSIIEILKLKLLRFTFL